MYNECSSCGETQHHVTSERFICEYCGAENFDGFSFSYDQDETAKMHFNL